MTKLLLTAMNEYVESVTSPINKHVWKTIAACMNSNGYNVSAENCNIKWTGMKNKYKTLKDASNQTGAAKQTKWEYYDIINDMLIKKPEIAPLSLASSLQGFKLNHTAVNTSKNIDVERNVADDIENDANALYFKSSNPVQERMIKKRKRKTQMLTEALIEQKQQQHKKNYEQRERFLSLFERYLNK